MSPLISVIIPTWNRAMLLRRAIDSVMSQTLAPIEILVIDDGSTDETEAMVRQNYAGVRYIKQSHRGVSASRNHGIRVCRGDWIAFLDSDDAWKSEKLETQWKALSLNQGISVCHTEELWVRNGKRVNPRNKHRKSGGRIFQHCLPLCAISPSSVMIHKGVFDDIGVFDEALPACEDYDLWLRITAHYEVLFIEEALLTKYGGHEDQLSRTVWGLDRFRVYALEKIINSRSLEREDELAALNTLIEKSSIVAQGALKRGEVEIALKYETIASKAKKELSPS